MRNLLCIFTIALLCIITFTGRSEEKKFEFDTVPTINPKFEVELSVTCDDDNTKAFIESHIKRELRSLQDVEIVDTGKYKLSIVAVAPTYKSSGQKTGSIAVSYTFLKQFYPTSVFKKLLDTHQKGTKAYDEMRDLLYSYDIVSEFFSLYHYPHHGIRTGDTDDLDSICKNIVVRFDTQILEPDRK